MENDVKRTFLPFNLQFFAENDDESKNGDNVEEANENENENDTKRKEDDGQKERMFTQAEVSRMMAKEKKEGRQSILNSLGYKTEEDAKNAFNLLKALQDSQKSESDKKEEEKNTAIQFKAEAEKRAQIAEAKLSCIVNGVDKESVDDVLTIALSKVSDDNSLDDVLVEMKTQAKYSSFFVKEKEEGQQGTGSTVGHTDNGGNDKDADYGKSIAEKYAPKVVAENKSKFF